MVINKSFISALNVLKYKEEFFHVGNVGEAQDIHSDNYGRVIITLSEKSLSMLLDNYLTLDPSLQVRPITEKSWADFSTMETQVRSGLLMCGSYYDYVYKAHRVIDSSKGGAISRLEMAIRVGLVALAQGAVKYGFPTDTFFSEEIDAQLYRFIICRISGKEFL